MNSLKPNARFNASDTIEKIGEMVEKNLEPSLNDPDTRALFRIFKDCKISTKIDARNMYHEMSREVHGSPWYERSVSVVAERLTKEQICVIRKIAADIFCLQIAQTTAMPEDAY
jgi:hypothetical protein